MFELQISKYKVLAYLQDSMVFLLSFCGSPFGVCSRHCGYTGIHVDLFYCSHGSPPWLLCALLAANGWFL